MAIVNVNCPSNVTKVNYGAIAFQPGGEPLAVPAYVAKTLITLSGFSCGSDLSASYDSMITGTTAPFELNYLFGAYGVAVPPSNQIPAAAALMDGRGPPAVSSS